jgi:HK97 family phage prohead protease
MKKEIRTYNFEIRALDDNKDGNMVIEGHAAVFDQEYNCGEFDETVKRGAFTQAVKEDDVCCLWQHDMGKPLGRTTNNTLQLKEDETGLAMRCEMAPTTYAKDLQTLIKRKDITQMSFSFNPRSYIAADSNGDQHEMDGDSWSFVNNRWKRQLTNCKLYDVSPVAFGANSNTDVSTRSLEIFESIKTKAADKTAQEIKSQAQAAAAARGRSLELKIKEV